MFLTATFSARRERWISTLFFFISGIISASWSSRIPEVQQHLRLNDAQWGRVLFALPAGLVLGLPVSSYLVARFGYRNVLMAASILFPVTLLLLSLCDTSVQLTMALFCFGFIRNLFTIANNTASIDIQKHYNRPIIATMHGIWSLACFAAAAFGTIMVTQHIGTETHFLIIALISILAGLLFKFQKQETPPSAERKPFLVKPDKYLFLLGAIAFCSMLCEGTMFDWSINYFNKVVVVEKNAITLGYTCFIIAMALGRLTGDRIVGRFGATLVLKANSVLMTMGVFIAICFPYLLPAALGFLLVGLGNSIVVPLVYSLSAKTKKMQPGYAIAAVTILGYMGFLTGPVLIGSVSNAWSMQWAFCLMGLLCCCIFFLTGKVKAMI